MTDIQKAKKEYRALVREKLKATTEDYRNKASAAIALNALNIHEMKEKKRTGLLGLKKTEKTVLAYCSVGTEPSTLALINSLLESGKRVCLPLCIDLDEEGHRTGTADAMEARQISGFDDLVAGAYGIPEPKPDTVLIPPEEIDLIILPCVTCDRKCSRLGHGAGYYDKYLKKVRPDCVTLALCYEAVMEDELPTEPHDMPVDAVITEKQIYRWRR